MGVTERKERKETELRDTILAGPRRIFSDEGVQARTVRRIFADAMRA